MARRMAPAHDLQDLVEVEKRVVSVADLQMFMGLLIGFGLPLASATKT